MQPTANAMLQDFLSNRPAIQSPGAMNAPGRGTGFQPLFAARAAALAAQDSEPDPESERLEAPQIELVREAGQVRRIVVTCTCCEKITIECEY